jgi:lipoprotein-anchoring transpeptidase ErfK/SrfK
MVQIRHAICACAALVLLAPVSAQQRQRAAELECGSLLAFQILLDRQHFSPGEIDGKAGPNFARAITAFQSARGLAPSGVADCPTWQALGGESGDATITTYRLTAEDIKGPFTERIPRSLTDQAGLPALGYGSAIEKLSERFHISPQALRALNPGARFAADEEIKVPAVEAFDVERARPSGPAAGTVSLTVSRHESALRVTADDGSLVFFAPVTTGSEHDPLPPGDWMVTAVSWMPRFNYNPDLFWDAKPGDGKATLKPGPNNPVGVVWIDVNIEHYGIHGTPEPGRVGHTESHGCVRLTNWDAAKLARLVGPGTPVYFR